MTNLSLPNEIWKPVKGFESRFKISNFGRLLSINGKYGGEKILTLGIANDGYVSVQLRSKPLQRRCRLHQLVAEHFLEKPATSERLEIDHKDCNRANNHVNNLRWVTVNEHRRISVGKGEIRKGSNHGMSKLDEAQVIEIRSMYASGNFTQQAIADKFGICRRHISDIVNRVNWSWLT